MPAVHTWLFLTYLLHTTGELCLSPVGLSSISKLAPKRFASQMMGIWFLGSALGNIIAGLVAGRFNPESLHDQSIRCPCAGAGRRAKKWGGCACLQALPPRFRLLL